MPDAVSLQAFPTPTTLLQRALRRFPDRLAFGGADAVTYAALEDVVARFQAFLVAAGVGPGRTVTLLSRNRWDSWAAASAVSALGAAPCWLHPLGTGETHCEQAVQIDPAAVIIDAATFPDRVEALAAALPGVPLFTIGGGHSALDLWTAAEAGGAQSLHDLSRADGLGMVGLTGGTTGKSKAVERSVHSVASMSIVSLASYDIPTHPNFLALGPISHVTGTMILPSLMQGGTVFVADRFDPEAVLEQIARDRITFTLGVPTMIYDLLDAPALDRCDTSSLRLLIYGGASMSPHRLAEGLDRIGPVFSQLYGQAECHPIAVLGAHDHDPSSPETLAACGYPVRGCEVTILNENLEGVAAGELGEICVRGPGVMTRYRDAPDATAEAFAGGWLHTGDLGRLDQTGRLYIVDRKKDMIVSGGFNLYPREIEDVLTGHPDVAAAAVVGLPDPRWGEAMHAVVTLRAGCVQNGTALLQAVRDRKGSLMTPKSVTVVQNLPLTAAGKVDKRRLVLDLLATRT